ncbi:MAG: pyridoxal phosphate-dependent aminotransferase [Rhizobiaceae bacterium]
MKQIDSLGPAAGKAPISGIIAAVDHGREKEGLIPLWAGEGDLPTPEFICRPANAAMLDGETFYTWNRGIPDLRQALARYHQRHFGNANSPDRHIVTGSGMQSIQLAIQAIAGHGDDIVYLSPAWPNFPAALGIAGGNPIPVELSFDGKWKLDADHLVSAITPRTKAIFVNSPSNPTGWTADKGTLSDILQIARRNQLWIIADETYALFHYGEGRAASFFDVMNDDDLIIFANTFSKNWAMTGWRIGWLTVHPDLQQTFENLIQYSTSGVSQFLQRGAIAALDEGDSFIASQVARASSARDLVASALASTNRVANSPPDGAFYYFFRVDGITDTRQAVFDIIDNAGVGLAPGSAFGPGGSSYFRLCFHRRLDQLEQAMDRLCKWIREN